MQCSGQQWQPETQDMLHRRRRLQGAIPNRRSAVHAPSVAGILQIQQIQPNLSVRKSSDGFEHTELLVDKTLRVGLTESVCANGGLENLNVAIALTVQARARKGSKLTR